MASRMTAPAAVMLAVFVSAAPHAADAPVWQFSESGDDGPSLVYGVPETDGASVSAACKAPDGVRNASTVTFGVDIGRMASGREVDVRFSGGGFEQTLKGTTKTGEGEALTGVVVTVGHGDPIWTAFAVKPQVEVRVAGGKATKIANSEAENIDKFVAACRTYAGTEKPAAKPTATARKKSAGKVTESGGSSEKDDFEAAKELGTVDAWEAFLEHHSKGFRADLARGYIKKLGGKVTAAPAEPELEREPQRDSGAESEAEEISCSRLRRVRSEESKDAATITFVNKSGMHRAIQWLDSDGTPKDMADLGPGDEKTFDTFVTHPWIVATGPGDCIQIFLPARGKNVVSLQRAPVDDGPKGKND